MPLIGIALLLFILLPLLNRGKGSGLSSGDRATATRAALTLIDTGETAYKARTGHYTSHLADLVSAKGLAQNLAAVLTVQLDASSDGNTFVAQVASDVLSLVRVRTGDKITANACRVVKKAKGVDCPKPVPKTKTGS